MPIQTESPTCNSVLAEHAAEIRRLGQRVIGDVIEIGRHLVEAKKLCGHGNWLPWLNRELGWTEQTALNFMRVHELAKTKNFLDLAPDLSVSALYLLAAPSTPEAARTEVIERAKAGETLAVAEVKRVVERAKGRQQSAHKPPLPPPPDEPKPAADVQAIRDAAAKRIRSLMRQPEPPTTPTASGPKAADADWSVEEKAAYLLGRVENSDLLACLEEADEPVQREFIRYLQATLRGDSIFDLQDRDDISSDSTNEAERLRARVEELQAELRQSEIKIAGLEREIKEAKASHARATIASRCEICREERQAVLRGVCVCDRCVEIHELDDDLSTICDRSIPLPVRERLELLAGHLFEILASIESQAKALQLPSNASVKRQSQLEGLQAVAGTAFDYMNVIRDQVAEIKQQLVAYEQRSTTEAPPDPAPPAEPHPLDIPDYLDRMKLGTAS
jgi:Protein of unknown function (DUF3102)